MDNFRFNVSGDTKEGLEKTLSLYWSLYRMGSARQRMDFTGYRIDPVFGMVLLVGSGNKNCERFPFDEGKRSESLASFFYNYLQSDSSKLDDIPNEGEEGYEKFSRYPYEQYLGDFHRDRSYDSGDVSGNLGWRVYTGIWGRISDNWNEIVAIRPAWSWYGK